MILLAGRTFYPNMQAKSSTDKQVFFFKTKLPIVLKKITFLNIIVRLLMTSEIHSSQNV